MLEAQQYEDANLTERTEEHTGVGPFAEQALVTKKAALQKVFLDTEEERQKHTVAAGPAAMQPSQLLQTLQKAVPGLKLAMGGEASGSDPAAPAVAPSGAAEVEEQEEEEAEEEEEICPAEEVFQAADAPCIFAILWTWALPRQNAGSTALESAM